MYPPVVNATNAVFLSYEQLRRLLPDRVQLARIDDIFRSWSQAEAKLAPEDRIVCDNLKNQRFHLTYEFDHYTYCSGMSHVLFFNRKPQYNIKLANDGFIYPSSSTLETDPSYDDSYSYHGSTGWSRLSTATLEAHFPSVIGFAENFFKSDATIGEVLYNESRERMDFRFKVRDPAKDSIRLVITFEKGYPYHFHNDDNWGEPVVGEKKLAKIEE